jgi:aspartate/methionine/tyrosine aminotransferase
VLRRRAAGVPLLDLTGSNPTRAGLPYPEELAACFADPGVLRYDPQPVGLLEARRAVAEEYGRGGADVSPDEVILTASTSEAYSYLFKLFCNPGDDVLVPSPSYPLFEQLARLDGVELRPYRLDYHGVWSIDVESLIAQRGSRTRAVLVVAPNNPTGSYLRAAEWARLRQWCAAENLPLVCDEVFLDYPLEIASDAVRGVLVTPGREDSVVVSLGGLSKSVGLPQYKLAWMTLGGPPAALDAVRSRLEWIADSYLSVSTPVQVAAGELLQTGRIVRAAIAARLARNLDALRTRIGRSPACSVLRVEGGWSAVIRVPALMGEEELACSLVDHDGVLVHPGYFFDFPREAYLVVSLLTDPPAFDEGIERLCRRVDA